MTTNMFENLAALSYRAGMSFHEFTDQAHRGFLIHALKAAKWNQCKAAALLGMHRNSLARYIHELNIKIEPRTNKEHGGR